MMGECRDLWMALPEIFVALSAMTILMMGAFKGERGERSASILAVAALLFAAMLAIGYGGSQTVVFRGLFVVDAFAVFTKVLVLIAAAGAIVLSMGWAKREGVDKYEFPVILLLAVLGMLMMISANDLMSLYVGLETQSLALYVAAAFRRDDARSSEAGVKYFTLGALSSGLLLYGASLVYGFAGTTGFDRIAGLFAGGGTPSTGLVVGLVFVVAGLAFKISAAPFHMWTPDVYEGAPTPVTAFFAVAPKVAAIALLVRVLVEPFGAISGEWRQVIVAASVLSMTIGPFAAIVQTNIKRLMAYSSIGHVGYALVGLAAGTAAGVRGVLIYMAIYVFMTLGAFAVILIMKRKGRMVEGIDDLRGLSRTHPRVAAAMAIFMFSMAGIPPLAGFFGKLYVFLAAIEAGLVWLAVYGVLTSVVGAFFYLRIIKLMYFDEVREPLDRSRDQAVNIVMWATAAFTALFFLLPTPLLNAAGGAAAVFFQG